MIYQLLEMLLFGFVCGVIGVVYARILAYKKILNWWFVFGNRFEKKWFFDPIWGCLPCICGQISFWFWLLIKILPAISRHLLQGARLNDFPIHYAQTGGALVLGWLSAICAAIVTALFLGTYLEDKK